MDKKINLPITITFSNVRKKAKQNNLLALKKK